MDYDSIIQVVLFRLLLNSLQLYFLYYSLMMNHVTIIMEEVFHLQLIALQQWSHIYFKEMGYVTTLKVE